MPGGELVTAGCVSVVYVYKLCMKNSGRLECNLRFVGPGVSCKWEMGVPLG
jgi:hypothetical protein